VLLALISVAWAGASGGDAPPQVDFVPFVDVRGRAMMNYTEGLSKGVRDDVSAVDRARLGVDLRRQSVGARVAAQQYRAWTADPTSPGDYVIVPPTVEFHEAYAHVGGQLPGGVRGSVDVGRQLITIHRGTLVSERDFDFRGLPLDAVRVQLELGGLRLDALNYRDFGETGISDPGTAVLTLGARQERPVTAWIVELLVIGETPADLGTRGTVGPYLWVESGPLGAEYMEWTGNLVDGPRGGFVRPAGALYAVNGHMNLFLSPEDTSFKGLRDAQLSIVLDPRPQLQIDLDGHAFWLAGTDGRHLGTELDATLRYWFSAVASVEGGYFSYASGPGTAVVRDLQGGLNTGYLQLRVGL
jgi:hypothetical protein